MSPNRSGALFLVLLAAVASAQELTPEKARQAASLVQEAELLIQAEKFEEAVPKLTEAGELNPYEVMAPFFLAECEFRLAVARDEPERLTRAKERLDQAFRVDPRFGGTFFLVGLIGIHEKDFRAATFGFEKAFAAGYRVSDARANLAQCLFFLGLDMAGDPRVEPAETIRVFLGALDRLEALKDDTRFTDEARRAFRGLWLGTMTNLVSLYQAVDEPEKALKVGLRLAKVEPENHMNWFNLGLLYGTVARLDEAMTAYEKALELRPDSDWIEPYPLMAYILSERGKPAEAERLFGEYLAKHPDSWDGNFRLAGHYMKVERPADAAAAYERCIEIDPNQIGAMFELGRALKAADEPARAEKWLSLFSRLTKLRDSQPPHGRR